MRACCTFYCGWTIDIFMGCNDATMRGNFMKAFSARFRVKDLGTLTQGLGSSIEQDLQRGTVKLSLSTYIGDVARKFDLDEDVADLECLQVERTFATEAHPSHDAVHASLERLWVCAVLLSGALHH